MNTKDKIIYTTIEIIGKQGVHNATAGNISKLGNFNKSIIFYYFKNIDELLLTSLNISVEQLSPIFKENFKEYSSFEDYLNFTIANLINDRQMILYLKVILSFAHQSMFLKKFLNKLHTILFDDVHTTLVKAIDFYKTKDIPEEDIDTLASLIMTTFNGLGVILLIDGSNDKFIKNWKLQVELISYYIA